MGQCFDCCCGNSCGLFGGRLKTNLPMKTFVLFLTSKVKKTYVHRDRQLNGAQTFLSSKCKRSRTESKRTQGVIFILFSPSCSSSVFRKKNGLLTFPFVL